jgi:hypothetical protein
MLKWRSGVYILVWCLKERDIHSLLRKMYTPHPHRASWSDFKMYTLASTCASWSATLTQATDWAHAHTLPQSAVPTPTGTTLETQGRFSRRRENCRRGPRMPAPPSVVSVVPCQPERRETQA